MLCLGKGGSGGRRPVPVGPRRAPTPPHRSLCFTRRRMPSLLEYLSYNCNFMGVLAGPLCSFKDYITFIEGRSYHATQSGDSGRQELHDARAEPSPNVRPQLACSPHRARASLGSGKDAHVLQFRIYPSTSLKSFFAREVASPCSQE